MMQFEKVKMQRWNLIKNEVPWNYNKGTRWNLIDDVDQKTTIKKYARI